LADIASSGLLTSVTVLDHILTLATIKEIRAVLMRIGKVRIAANFDLDVEESGKTASKRIRRVRSTTHVESDCTSGKAMYTFLEMPAIGLKSTLSYSGMISNVHKILSLSTYHFGIVPDRNRNADTYVKQDNPKQRRLAGGRSREIEKCKKQWY
jgi:hypothetical protein